MATMYGANTEELDRLSTEINTAAEEIDSEAKQMTSTLNNITWLGGIATAFLDRWTSVSVAQMEGASEFLRDAACNLAQQAEQQRVASGEGGMGSSGPWGGGGVPGGGVGRGGGGVRGGGSWGGRSWTDIFSPGISGKQRTNGHELKLNIIDVTAWEHGFLGDAGSVKLGDASAGIGYNMKDGHQYIGAFGQVTVARVDVHGNLVGNDDYGVDAGAGVSVLKGTGFVGYKDGNLGWELGGTLASVDGQVGVNVGGHDVAVTGEIGFKLELGVQIGTDTKIKLGPISVGFHIGW